MLSLGLAPSWSQGHAANPLTTARHGGMRGEWGGLLDCHEAQVVLPNRLDAGTHSLVMRVGQLEGPQGAQSTSLP